MRRTSINYLILFFCYLLVTSFSGGVNKNQFSERINLIVLEGTYQGKNIKIKNPYIVPGQRFCIQEIYVNEDKYTYVPASDVIINLSGFKKGEYVNIQITHDKNACEPIIENTQSLRAKSTFEIVAIEVKEGMLRWTTKNERTQEPYIIEQKLYNKWVPIGKVIAKGTDGYNPYNFPVKEFSGENAFRIKQKGNDNSYRYSEICTSKSDMPSVSFYPHQVANIIYLSRRARYQIFTENGISVASGEDYQIHVPNLVPGPYYLYIDNKVERFLKK